MRVAAIAVVLSLTACVTSKPPRSAVVVQPDMAGLQINPVNKRIDFGRSPKGVVPVLDRELGGHEPLSLAGCPSGVVQQLRWDDLVLTFTGERFVGWKSQQGQSGATCI